MNHFTGLLTRWFWTIRLMIQRVCRFQTALPNPPNNSWMWVFRIQTHLDLNVCWNFGPDSWKMLKTVLRKAFRHLWCVNVSERSHRSGRGHKWRWRERCRGTGRTDQRERSKDTSHFTGDGEFSVFNTPQPRVSSHSWRLSGLKVGDLPDAEIKPPENVLFVCKLNPVTTDDDLEIIFSRFGSIKWWENTTRVLELNDDVYPTSFL